MGGKGCGGIVGAGGAVVAYVNAEISTRCCFSRCKAVGTGCSRGRYLCVPPVYPSAISLDSSKNSTFHSGLPYSVTMLGGRSHQVSMKFSLMPLLHSRLLLRQFWQLGHASSHLRWRSLQVRHPVRTRFGLLLSPLLSPSPPLGIESVRGPTFLIFLLGLLPVGFGGVLRF